MGEASFDLPECLRRVRRHDENAARQLVEHLYPQVRRIVATKVPRRSSEEDLAQEIFIKMFTKLDQYRGDMPFEHWVSRIAVNHCLNAIRAQNSRPEWRWADLTPEQTQAIEAALTSAADTPDPSRAIAARELVDKLLDTLEPTDQWLIRLLELEERSIEEVRQLTGWSATRIRVRAFRARRRLNKNFQRLKSQNRL
ncbi:MAG TPA: RNA polymerase sigma factor [Verrucomicrobiae bacterium]|nr:RNA polymerase sigma factor [Verrucomicrobiae bacterium]